MFDVKEYDKQLFTEKLLDGTILIKRESSYELYDFDVFKIQNQFIGSGKWIKRKLESMDCQRNDLFGEVEKHNDKITNKKRDTRMSEELGQYLAELGCSVTI